MELRENAQPVLFSLFRVQWHGGGGGAGDTDVH